MIIGINFEGVGKLITHAGKLYRGAAVIQITMDDLFMKKYLPLGWLRRRTTYLTT